jgi:hypothetical protein
MLSNAMIQYLFLTFLTFFTYKLIATHSISYLKQSLYKIEPNPLSRLKSLVFHILEPMAQLLTSPQCTQVSKQ